MKRIFFDFDGTLADTGAGIINGYNYAFDKKGMPRPSEKTVRENIGPPLKDVLSVLAPAESPDGIDELATLYREYYSSEGLYELEFFDGIIEMLDRLGRKNVQLCILSSKPTVFIEKILDRHGHREYFARIDGISLEYTNKSKKERLKDRITGEGLVPADCMVVGDRAEDMNAAEYCGTDFIGILFGYGSENELNCSRTAGSVKDLNDLLMSWTDA